MKLCMVGSSGGHLAHLYLLRPLWGDRERFWVTFDKEDARSLLEGERMYPCYYPTNRSLAGLAGAPAGKTGPDCFQRSGGGSAVFLPGQAAGGKADLC